MAKGIGDVIYNLLSNDTGVTDITSTRIYPFMAVEDIAYPYLVYTIESTDPTQTKCTASALDVVSVNIEIYTETLSESETLKRNIRNLLDRYKGTVEGVEVQSISFRDEDGGYADEDRVYLDIQAYSCRLKTITASFSRVTDLAAAGSSSSQIDLTWSDVATGETGWEVWRSTDFISWTLISTEAADSTSYSNTGLTADTSYVYKVRAINATNEGEWSNVAIGNTDSAIAVVSEWFEIEVDTSIVDYSVAGTFAIGISSGTFFVDWGDGSAIEHLIVTAITDARMTHIFPTSGTYTVKLKGDGLFSWISRDGDKIINLKNWGSFKEASANAMMYGCSNMIISATDVMIHGSSDGRNTFLNNSSIVLFPITFNASQMTVASSMFSGCTNFDDGSAIGKWDMSSLINGAANMFLGTSMSTASCDAILIGWTRWGGGTHNITLNSNQALHLGTTSYTLGGDAEDAFNYLVNTLNWVITIL